MANIKAKNINELDTWNNKELRKLRMVLKNRISELQFGSKKELYEGHPLFQMGEDQCKKLLEKVVQHEAKLKK